MSSQPRPDGTAPRRRLHLGCERTLVILFVLMLAMPGLAMIAGFNVGNRRGENRTYAPFPAVTASWESVRAFPEGFTRYFEDHFAFRAPLITAQAAFRDRVMNTSASPAVVKGRNGWLFYADDDALADYLTERPLTDAELEGWRRALEHTHDRLASSGITFLFVIAPDKHAVYPEAMPDTIRPLHQRSRTDQLVAYLDARSRVRAVDLRPALWRAKARERLYHRTDTHWNDRGAFVAYQEILKALAPTFPQLSPSARREFDESDEETTGLDLAGMLGLDDVMREQTLRLRRRRPAARTLEPLHPNPYGEDGRIVTDVPGLSAPRLLVYRDSFGSALVPFLADHFSRAVFLWDKYLDFDTIARERPDIVIQEWCGRRLTSLPPYDPGALPPDAPRSANDHRDRP